MPPDSPADRLQSEEHYRLLVESATDYAILTLDADGRIASWSAGAERIVGMPEAEALGQSIAILFTDEDRAARVPEAELARAAAEGRSDDERWHRRADGSRFWANGIMTALREPDGTLVGFAKILRDDTRRRVAEDALRASEERLQLALDASSIGTYTYDVEADRFHADARTCAILGLGETFSLDRWLDAVHPADALRIHAAIAAALDPSSDGLFNEAYRAVHPDGEVRWLYLRSRTLFEGEGRARSPVRVVGTTLDVTDRKRTEEALRESEARGRLIAETVPDVLFTATPGGRVDYVNEQLRRMTGRSPEEALDTLLWPDLLHPDDRQRTARAWAEARRRQTPLEIRHRFLTSDGTCWGLTRARPVFALDGAVERWFGTVTDIDALVRAETEVLRLNATLEKQVEARTEQVRHLTARLAEAEQEERRRLAHLLHDDLQQRLAGLGITIHLLCSARSPEETGALRTRAEEILDGTTALTRTLATELSPPALASEHFAEALRTLALHQRDQLQMEVEVEADGGCDVPDAGIRDLLYQMLRELLFNVVKHAGTRRAHLRARRDGADVIVQVVDDGVGFDPSTAVGEEAGFGLFSVRERLALVGGRLTIDSAPGRGATVTLTAPAGDPPPDSAASV